MRRQVALIALIAIPWLLIAWTITVHVQSLPPLWASSYMMRLCTMYYPILAFLLGYITCGALSDGFPQYHWAKILFAVVVPAACIGHVLWGW